MSKITLRPKADQDSRFWRLVAGQGYQDHKFLWGLFSDGPERKRDFLFRRMEEGQDRPGYLAVSARKPQEDNLWRVRIKPYQPKLRQGQRLAFSLRVNPVVSRRDENGKQQRHDVIMDHKHKLKEQNLPREKWLSQAEMVQQAGTTWLTTRAEKCGFQVDPEQVHAEGYHQVRFHKGRRQVSLTSLELSGVLTVEDPEKFLQTLYFGMGPAKGYGFGLLLVKPA
jgi:CRISPR system Cascade subunit CasE